MPNLCQDCADLIEHTRGGSGLPVCQTLFGHLSVLPPRPPQISSDKHQHSIYVGIILKKITKLLMPKNKSVDILYYNNYSFEV